MNELQIFKREEFGQIRTVLYEDKPYFVGIDVAKALEYAKPSQAVIDHCKGIRKLGIPSEGGIQETNIISEGDVYRLIIKAADQSKSEKVRSKAEQFEKWVFDFILPAVRTDKAINPVYFTGEQILSIINLTIERAVANTIDEMGIIPAENDYITKNEAEYMIKSVINSIDDSAEVKHLKKKLSNSEAQIVALKAQIYDLQNKS